MQNKTGHFEKIRSKPITYRQSYAILVSAGITLVIFGIWSVSTVARFVSPQGDMAASASSSFSAFSLIKDQFSEAMDSNPFVGNKASLDELGPGDAPQASFYATTTPDEEASTSSDILVQ